MRSITTLLLCSLLLGCGKGIPGARQRLEDAMTTLKAAESPEQRFYALPKAAKESFAAGKVEDAKKYAEELMTLLPDFRKSRDYSDALHDANMVLGRIAVREGRMEDAKRFLIESAQISGSPDMMNYGPNMRLAKDLLEKGERQAVLDYFEGCRKFWVNNAGKLDKWSQEVRNGKVPDFGRNLFN